jgi:hypothetical protein
VHLDAAVREPIVANTHTPRTRVYAQFMPWYTVKKAGGGQAVVQKWGYRGGSSGGRSGKKGTN